MPISNYTLHLDHFQLSQDDCGPRFSLLNLLLLLQLNISFLVFSLRWGFSAEVKRWMKLSLDNEAIYKVQEELLSFKKKPEWQPSLQ